MAAAADMPLKAPPLPPAPVVLLWDNVYIGLEGGYGQAHQSWDQNTTYASAFSVLRWIA
jgi:hypothetical protein